MRRVWLVGGARDRPRWRIHADNAERLIDWLRAIRLGLSGKPELPSLHGGVFGGLQAGVIPAAIGALPPKLNMRTIQVIDSGHDDFVAAADPGGESCGLVFGLVGNIDRAPVEHGIGCMSPRWSAGRRRDSKLHRES